MRTFTPITVQVSLHLLASGLQISRVALKDAADEAEFGKRLVAFDRKLPRDRWLLGGEWDHDRTFKGVLPTAELIDKYVAERPVFLRRYDGHMAVVNSRVLRMARITTETPDPPGPGCQATGDQLVRPADPAGRAAERPRPDRLRRMYGQQ